MSRCVSGRFSLLPPRCGISSILSKTAQPRIPWKLVFAYLGMRFLWCLSASLCFAGLSVGQVSPGYPSFSANDCHEVDCVNLQNGNITLRVPIVSKSGAFPFNYGLVGNFYVYKNGSNWEPAQYTSIGEPAGGLIASLNGLLPIWSFPLVYNTPVGATCPGT
jgi:hypothetical protein